MTDALRAEIRKLESADDFDAAAWMRVLVDLLDYEREAGFVDAWRRMRTARARVWLGSERNLG